jgi:hypothetical protein
MEEPTAQICEEQLSESDSIKDLARKELYGTVFDVWVTSGRDLTYSNELWEYFCIVVSPMMMEHMPTQQEFFGILLMEQNRRRHLRGRNGS